MKLSVLKHIAAVVTGRRFAQQPGPAGLLGMAVDTVPSSHNPMDIEVRASAELGYVCLVGSEELNGDPLALERARLRGVEYVRHELYGDITQELRSIDNELRRRAPDSVKNALRIIHNMRNQLEGPIQ